MMYNPQLETFLCVVEAGSFSKAAEKMYITAPAVIKQINSLESSLNLQLFDRTHRGLIVTEAGKSLYKDTKYIIQYSKDSVARAQNAMKENKEVIRVCVSPMTPPQVFVELWPKIQKMYSDIKFQIVTFENIFRNLEHRRYGIFVDDATFLVNEMFAMVDGLMTGGTYRASGFHVEERQSHAIGMDN